jgi:hypothetical protein
VCRVVPQASSQRRKPQRFACPALHPARATRCALSTRDTLRDRVLTAGCALSSKHRPKPPDCSWIRIWACAVPRGVHPHPPPSTRCPSPCCSHCREETASRSTRQEPHRCRTGQGAVPLRSRGSARTAHRAQPSVVSDCARSVAPLAHASSKPLQPPSLLLSGAYAGACSRRTCISPRPIRTPGVAQR